MTADRRSADDWALADAAGRDPDALGELFRRHRDFVFRVAYAHLGHREDAEEVVQDVFMALARRRRLFRRARFTTWLYRVVRNRAIDRLRRVRRSAPGNPQAEQPDIAGDGWDLEVVLERLRQLPHRQREAVLLRIFEGYSVKETAALMGVTMGSVKTHQHRGLQTLRRLLEGNQEGEQK